MDTKNPWDFDVHSQDSLAHPNHLEPHGADMDLAPHQDMHPLPGIGHDDGLQMGHVGPDHHAHPWDPHFGRAFGHVDGEPKVMTPVFATDRGLEKLQNGPEAHEFSLAVQQADGRVELVDLSKVHLPSHHQRKD